MSINEDLFTAWTKRGRKKLLKTGESAYLNRTAWGLGGILMLVFLIQGYGKTLRPEGNDFTAYLQASALLVQGQDIYQADLHFPPLYPLVLPMLLIPFLWVPNMLAYPLWFAVNLAALLNLVYRLANTQTGRPLSNLGVPVFLVLLVFVPVLQNNVLNGQVNLLVLWLSMFFLQAYQKNRCILAALALAAAVGLKIVPILFLLFLLIRRDWLTSLFTLFAIACLGLLPAVFMGSGVFESYSHFASQLSPWLNQDAPEHAFNRSFSFSGVLFTLQPDWFDSFWVKWGAMSLVGMALLGMDFLSRSTKHLEWTFACYWLAVLLISPISETHHLVFAIPGFALLLFCGIFGRDKTLSPAWLGALLFTILFYIGDSLEYGVFMFLALAILWIFNAWIIRIIKNHHES